MSERANERTWGEQNWGEVGRRLAIKDEMEEGVGRKGIFLTHPFPLLLIFSRSIASRCLGKEPALRKEAEIKVTACFDR